MVQALSLPALLSFTSSVLHDRPALLDSDLSCASFFVMSSL